MFSTIRKPAIAAAALTVSALAMAACGTSSIEPTDSAGTSDEAKRSAGIFTLYGNARADSADGPVLDYWSVGNASVNHIEITCDAQRPTKTAKLNPSDYSEGGLLDWGDGTVTSVTISDTSLTVASPGTDAATANNDFDREARKFVGYCDDAGTPTTNDAVKAHASAS